MLVNNWRFSNRRQRSMAFHQSMADVEEVVNKVVVMPVETIRKVEIKVEVEKEDKAMEEVEVALVLVTCINRVNVTNVS
jgi:hypothetical protein